MRVAIISAGAGGHAMAADLTLKGHTVAIYSRTADKVAALRANGGVQVTGILGDRCVRIDKITSDIADVMRDADLIVLPVPGMVQENYLRLLIPHITAGQPLFICPGSGGALVAQRLLREAGKPEVLVIDSLTLPYGARMTGPGSVAVVALIRVAAAAFPAKRTPEAIDLLRQAWEVVAATNVLETALMNVNPIIHPLPALLNWGWIEHRQREMSIYSEGMSPGVLKCLYAIDAERAAICRAAGVNAIAIDDIYAALGLKPIYRMVTGLGKADRYQDRFIAEDVPFGLATFASIGKQFQVPTPRIDAVVELSGCLYDTDYWARGRTADSMGIAGMSGVQISEFLRDGTYQ